MIHSAPGATTMILSCIAMLLLSNNHVYSLVAFSTTLVAKQRLIASLDTLVELNDASDVRTQLVADLCNKDGQTSFDSTSILQALAQNSEWRVIYAPHMSAMGQLLGKSQFSPVIYKFHHDDASSSSGAIITSHARVQFPWLIPACWMSVSGTVSNVATTDRICRVDFDATWMKPVVNYDDTPYHRLDNVPDGLSKRLVNKLGKLLFIEQVAVFPISYLDEDLVVFDFELFGTRICARRIVVNDTEGS